MLNRPIFSLFLAPLFALVACSSDPEPSSSSTSSSGSTSGSSGSSGSSGGEQTSSSSTSSSSSSSSSGESGGTKPFGADCKAGSECQGTTAKCVLFTDNSGVERGFCSRICTKSADCPETGYECNLAPYTACVPAK